jgi:hypothetical protein
VSIFGKRPAICGPNSHVLEPRFDEKLASDDPMVLVMLNERTLHLYSHDICIRCGMVVKRPDAP